MTGLFLAYLLGIASPFVAAYTTRALGDAVARRLAQGPLATKPVNAIDSAHVAKAFRRER